MKRHGKGPGQTCGPQYQWMVVLAVVVMFYASCLQVTAQTTSGPQNNNSSSSSGNSSSISSNSSMDSNSSSSSSSNSSSSSSNSTGDATGATCQNDTCVHGTCNVTNGTAACTCDQGWTGLNCSQGMPCQNDTCVHGTCNATSGTAMCTCDMGWTGYNCSQGMPCENDTCVHGTCNATSGAAMCTCDMGWTGYNCSQGMPCQNDTCVHGTCNAPSGAAMCTCDMGWTGYNCSQDVDECKQQVCQNEGICENHRGSYSCSCNTGWTGVNCDTDINECTDASKCPDPNDDCVNTNGSYTCVCKQGYERLKPDGLCKDDVLVQYATGTTQRMSGDDVLYGPYPIPYGFTIDYVPVSEYYISTNGYITFNSKFSQPNMPDINSSRIQPLAFLAPYWADIDIPQSNSTSGLYHVAISLSETYGNENLTRLFEKYKNMTGLTDFQPVFIGVVTWMNVLPYKAEDFSKAEPATFQVVMATNGWRIQGRVAWRTAWSGLGDLFNVSSYVHLTPSSSESWLPLTDLPSNKTFAYPTTGTPNSGSLAECVEWLSMYGPSFQSQDPGSQGGVVCPCSLAQAEADPLFSVTNSSSQGQGHVMCATSKVFNHLTARKTKCCYASGLLVKDAKSSALPELKDAGNNSVAEQGMKKCCSVQAANHPYACSKFRQVFPVDDCSGYRAPESALVWGNGHIVTADHTQYTFNGWGEYLLLRLSNSTMSKSTVPLAIQGRTEKLNITDYNTTTFTAFAVKYNDQSSFEVHTDSGLVKLYVNGEVKTAVESSLGSDIVVSNAEGNDTLDIVFPSGVTLKTKAWADGMSLAMTARSVGNLSEVQGLLVASSMGQGFESLSPQEKFAEAQKWSLQPNESFFAYNLTGQGDNFTSFQHPGFVPTFLNSSVEELLSELNKTSMMTNGTAVCGDKSVACLHDLLVTGSSVRAAETKATEDKFMEMRRTLGLIPPRFLTKDAVLNASMAAGMFSHTVDVGPEVTNSSLFPGVTPEVRTGPSSLSLNYTFEQTQTPGRWVFTWYLDEKVKALRHVTFTFKATSSVTGMTSHYTPTVLLCACVSDTQCDYTTVNQQIAAISKHIPGFWTAQCQCGDRKGGRFCQDDVSVCDVCFDASLCNSNVTGNGTCQCPQSFLGNGLKCYEKDECQKTDRCEHSCQNTRGSYRCSCRPGFTLVDNGRCKDKNECANKEDNCTSSQFCVNTEGSFVCPCRPSWGGENCQHQVKYRYGGEIQFANRLPQGQGWSEDLRHTHTDAFKMLAKKIADIISYVLKSNNVTIIDVTVLSFSPVMAARRRRSTVSSGSVTDIKSSFVVTSGQSQDSETLKKAFESGFNSTCTSDKCTYSGDPNESSAKLVGVKKSSAGFQENFDLCASERNNNCHNTSTTCASANGTTQCHCRHGYKTWILDNICQDINECADNSTLCGAKSGNDSLCRNTDGAYYCICPASFQWDATKKQCVEVTLKDVCSERKPCKNGAECVNTMDRDSYACRCTDGWTGVDCDQEDGEAERYKWTLIGVAIGLGVLCLIFLVVIIVICCLRSRSKSSDSDYEGSPKYADFRRRGSDVAMANQSTNGASIQRFSNPAYMDDNNDIISKRL